MKKNFIDSVSKISPSMVLIMCFGLMIGAFIVGPQKQGVGDILIATWLFIAGGIPILYCFTAVLDAVVKHERAWRKLIRYASISTILIVCTSVTIIAMQYNRITAFCVLLGFLMLLAFSYSLIKYLRRSNLKGK